MMLAGLALAVTPSQVQARHVLRDGFAFPADRKVKVVLFRPDVKVGSQSAGGLDEPNAEWTDAARNLLNSSLVAHQGQRSVELVPMGEPSADDAQLLNDYRGLFRAVAGAVMAHHYGLRLATKPANALDWSLGGDMQRLQALTQGSDYALFVFTHDSYGSTGRKVMQFLMAGLLGAYVPSGVHIGYAGLVDLKSGALVWFNSDPAMGGDVREPAGAAKRIEQLMAGFPAPLTAPVAPTVAPSAAP